jgi:hypothetical protein
MTDERVHRESVDFTQQKEMQEDNNVVETLEELEREATPEQPQVRRSSRLAGRKTTPKIKPRGSSKKRAPRENPRRQVERGAENVEIDEIDLRSGTMTIEHAITSREKVKETSRRQHRPHDRERKQKPRHHRQQSTTEDNYSSNDELREKRRNPARGKKSRHSKRKRSLP